MREEAAERPVLVVDSPQQLACVLRRPRVVLLLVPAGPPVDAVIRELLPLLEKDDLLVDGGNTHYTDTNLRAGAVVAQGLLYLGLGITRTNVSIRKGVFHTHRSQG